MSFNLFLNKVKPKISNENYYGYCQKHAFLAVLVVVHEMCRNPRVKNWFQKFYDVKAKKYNEIIFNYNKFCPFPSVNFLKFCSSITIAQVLEMSFFEKFYQRDSF